MEDYGTNLAEIFSATAVEKFFETAVTPMITNDDYEGEIKDKASRLNILTFSESEGLQNYTGSDLTLGTISESEGTIVTDQQKAYYFKIPSIQRFKSYAKDPESTLMVEKAGQLQEAVDTYVLGLAHSDAAAGNRTGTSYTTGTVTVTTSTGAVAGSGTTFAATMVGLGFKADGHSVWYRIKTYTSTTAIVIEDDKDDVTSAYTGGAISGGSTYEIEANTPVDIDSAGEAYAAILALKQKLDAAKTPKKGRWLVVNSYFMQKLLAESVVVRDTEQGEARTSNGFVTRMAGFDIYENEQLAGDNTDGFWAVAGTKAA
ncbi:hypothetical protein GW935_04800, partial [Candidatus Falkowbacteria bacterium]|nr:hypothetical protein [Candidatus Falkowbacteria bacterium]